MKRSERVGAVAELLDRHEPTKLPIAAAHGEPTENVEAERLADVPALLVVVVATDVARHAGKEAGADAHESERARGLVEMQPITAVARRTVREDTNFHAAAFSLGFSNQPPS